MSAESMFLVTSLQRKVRFSEIKKSIVRETRSACVPQHSKQIYLNENILGDLQFYKKPQRHKTPVYLLSCQVTVL